MKYLSARDEFGRRSATTAMGLPRLRQEMRDTGKVWIKRPLSVGFTAKRVIHGSIFNAMGSARGLHCVWHINSRRGLSHEADRLRHLFARGMPVPELLEQNRNQIVMRDVGLSLDKGMSQDPGMKPFYIEQASMALAQWHNAGEWHGDAIIYNMAWDGSRISFLDFEADPLMAMSPLEVQARDVWYLARSVAMVCEGHQPAVTTALMRYFGELNSVPRASIRDILARDYQGIESRLYVTLSGGDIRKNSGIAICAQAGLKAAL